MTFKLYNVPRSSCSQRVRFVFKDKKIPFDEVKLNLLEGGQLKPDYLMLNPNGVVPTFGRWRSKSISCAAAVSPIASLFSRHCNTELTP